MMDVVYAPGWPSAFEWTIWVGFFVAFLLAFGMGANDCANSYGTVVGAGVLKLWQAYLLATIFEITGAALLGYRVTETVRQGIIDAGIYNISSQWNSSANTYVQIEGECPAVDPPQTNCTVWTSAELLLGELGALSGTAFWLIVASIFKMPVSATQSVVGATIGYSVVMRGAEGIQWSQLISIVVSWISSPLLAGAISGAFYLLIKAVVFSSDDQLAASLRLIPGLLWFCLAVNFFTVFYQGSKYLHLDNTPWWLAILISATIGGITAVFMVAIGNKLVKKRAIAMNEESNSIALKRRDKDVYVLKRTSRKGYQYDLPEDTVAQQPSSIQNGVYSHGNFDRGSLNASYRSDTTGDGITKPMKEDPLACNVFNFLQILSASFLAFSHGSNDTANSVGPLVGLWVTYQHGVATGNAEASAEMEYILLFGAVSMLVGLYVLGHRVIETIGKDLTDVNAPSGFSMTMGTALTVLLASKIGIPVSTTHCMVGAVVLVGLCRSGSFAGVSWKLFGGIAFAWLVTTPVAAGVSALVTYLLVHFILGTV